MSFKILANCVVGLGFSTKGFEEGLSRKPDLIGCDAGSADFGPGYLGQGRHTKPRSSVTHDLHRMIEGSLRVGSPFVTGSCGGPGARVNVEEYLDIVREVASSLGRKIRVAAIYADQDASTLHRAIEEGRIRPLGPFPELSHDDIDQTQAIVAMMGAGPIIDALDAGVDIVLAGRCADPAIFACGPLRAGIAPGQAWHAAKTIDKGYLATTAPREGSPVMATVDSGGFLVEAMKEGVKCTVDSVASVTMHENPNPFRITQPSGTISVQNANYDQVDDRSVRVSGGEWEPATRPSVKLEGARLVGYRTIFIAGLRDPRLLSSIDEFLEEYRRLSERIAKSLDISPDDWQLTLRPYGHNAVLGANEPLVDVVPHEVGLVVDIVAKSQDLANTLISRIGPAGSRFDFTGHLGGGGNFAYPFSPNQLPLGPVYEWGLWHVMEVDDEREPFKLEIVDV